MSDIDTNPDNPASVWASDHMATSVVSTLLAGPAVYGLAGWGLDVVVGTTRVFMPIGIIVGFAFSFYIVYMRYGRGETPTGAGSAG